MILDRRKNNYHKVVTDPDTGEVLYECKEPLSEHRGHGSARDKSSKPKKV